MSRLGSGRPWIIAHRGASRDCPENTPAAFDEALRQGCDAIEMDVQLSRDGVPVVYHDRTLARAGGGRRRVAGVDAAELRRLDPGARFDKRFCGQHIPTLDEVVRRYAARTRLLVEIKSRESSADRRLELARAVASLVAERKVETDVLVLSFDARVLDVCATVAPRLRRVLNLRPPDRPGRRLLDRLPRLAALSVDVRTLTPGFASAIRAAGCSLLVFTCNTPARVRLAWRCGAAGVMADRPGWLARRLALEATS